MSDDWRAKVEAKEAKRREKEADRYARDQSRRFDEHYSRYRCHISGCHKGSSGPYYYTDQGGTPRFDLNRPTGVESCRRCDKWTCPEHIHMGICKDHS